jgi:uncharacterized protein
MSTPPPTPPQEPPGQPGGSYGGLTSDDRNWAVIAHLSALITIIGIPSLVGPLVVWLIKRDQPFVNEHGREALNFNITILIYVVALIIITIVTLGIGVIVVIPVGIVLFILWLVFLIQGAMAASRGQSYRYPLTIRLIT